MTTSRRILVVTPVVPHSRAWGFTNRILSLATELSGSHAVSLMCYMKPDDEQYLPVVQAMFEEVHVVPYPVPPAGSRRLLQARSFLSGTPYQRLQLRSPQLQQAVDALFERRSFDVVQLETTHLGELRFPPGVAVVLDEHNIEYELFERMAHGDRHLLRHSYYSLEASKLRRLERRHWASVDACLVTSDREAAIVREVTGPGVPTQVVPNGVDLEFFQPQPDTLVEPDRIVFTGLMSYRPNIDGVGYLVGDIAPLVRRLRPDAHVFAVGQNVADEVARLGGPSVTITGFVPDVRPYLASAAVVAVPLRMGSGTRLKVLEALAMGRPVVTTRLGAEGIDVRDGEHLLFADGPGDFADALVRVLQDTELAQRLSAGGRRLVEERYGWEAAGGRLSAFYGGPDWWSPCAIATAASERP